jgi:hypothetical protein
MRAHRASTSCVRCPRAGTRVFRRDLGERIVTTPSVSGTSFVGAMTNATPRASTYGAQTAGAHRDDLAERRGAVDVVTTTGPTARDTISLTHRLRAAARSA